MKKARIEVFKLNRAVTNGTIFLGNRTKLSFQNQYDDDGLLSAVTFEGQEAQSLKSIDLWKAMTTLYPESIKVINRFALMEDQILAHTVTPSAAGWTNVWTPTTNTKFRVLSAQISIPIGSTTADALFILLDDYDATIPASGVWSSIEISAVAMVATTQPIIVNVALPPDGYLAYKQNRSVRVYLSTAMTAGEVDVSIMGIEE